MLGCVLTDCRDSCLSFIVMCHSLNDVCLHVSLLLVRTALASRISTAFTQAHPTMINYLSSYTIHITPGGRVTMALGFTGCRMYHLPLLSFYLHTTVLTLSCMSGFAPAPSRSSTTLWWPSKLAAFSAVDPSCIVEWVRVTTWDGSTITIDSSTPWYNVVCLYWSN